MTLNDKSKIQNDMPLLLSSKGLEIYRAGERADRLPGYVMAFAIGVLLTNAVWMLVTL